MKKLFRKFITWAMSDANDVTADYAIAKSTSISSSDDTLRLFITNAIGGKVVSIESYDSHTNRSKQNVYIITDSENFVEQISHIVTIENLSR